MQPKIERHADGSMTISLTLPADVAEQSLLSAEEQLMDALNAVGCKSMEQILSGYDSDGAPMVMEGRKWTSKGRVSKIYETPWGEVILARHLYQSSAGGRTFCPLEQAALITAGTATPHLARSLSHKYANANARAVVRDLLENHGRKLAPSYVADVAAAVAEADAAARYFTHNVARMNYSLFTALHFPIGSGVTEAACKTLVKARLCGSGMQWTRSGAQTVLTLRALLLSTSRWASLWRHLNQYGLPLA